MANIQLPTAPLPPDVIQKIYAGKIKKVPYVLVFEFENLASGTNAVIQERTPSDGVFQIEYINIQSNDLGKFSIYDTFHNRNWFTQPTYFSLIGGKGTSYGFLPCPILIPASTDIKVEVSYDSNDPNTGNATAISGQIILGGYILQGLRYEDIYKPF